MIDTNRLIAMREIETNLRAEGQSSRADCFLELIYEIDRLRAELKYQTDNAANLQASIEGSHGRTRDLEAELAEERKPDCLLCKNYYEREDENDHALYRGCALRLRLTPSDCINGSEFISVGPVRLYEMEGKV